MPPPFPLQSPISKRQWYQNALGRSEQASEMDSLFPLHIAEDTTTFPDRCGWILSFLGKGELPSRSASTLMKSTASPEQISRIIRYAWEDRTTFEQIEERTGFTEKQVIDVMSRELKPSSFRLWRKRVGGRITKHRKLLEQHLKGPIDEE